MTIAEQAINKAKSFIQDYEKITPGSDYKGGKTLLKMQKALVQKLKEERCYSNWSGTGAGKTLSALVAGRVLNLRNMVIVCPNDVKDGWVAEILGDKDKKGAYPDNSRVINFTSINDIDVFNRNTFNYIIINYDKFSIDSVNGGINMINALLSTNQIDFLCFDEIHFVKSSNKNSTSIRRECIKHLRKEVEKRNPNVYVLGMTATPVVNNPYEGRSLLELITNKKFEEISTRKDFRNICLTGSAMINHGIRYIKKFGIVQKHEYLHIDGSDIANELASYCKKGRTNKVEIERILIKKKMNDPEVQKRIIPGTILFSCYRDERNNNAIINTITEKLKEMGLTYMVYVGGDNERGGELKKFINGKYDVLVATKPIATGVNGLQERSNRIIMLGYPWTGADYTQLIGRIDRQGSVFKEVDVIHPWVEIPLTDGTVFSLDKYYFDVVLRKMYMLDAIIDGDFSKLFDIEEKVILKRLANEIKQNGASDYTPNREEL